MDYKGIIITGTSGSGKSSIAKKLSEKDERFQIVRALTTRKRRDDDSTWQYEFVDREQFQRLEREGELLVKSEYRGEFYGISNRAFREAILQNKIPVMIITPLSVQELQTKQDTKRNGNYLKFLSLFLDVEDDLLNSRLMSREEEINDAVVKQREKDREYSEACLYTVKNTNIENTVELLISLWKYRETGGVLPKRLIQLMVECGMLLENFELQNISGAAYDLSLGDEYYYGGRIKTLSNTDPFILVDPYDYVIVTSKETTNFPRDVIGRFDLSVSLFCQGIILSNGPQVDPGFRGRLFCLLFNTSNAPIFLKRGQHYATLEFHKLIEPTSPYTGKYQGKKEIVYYLPSNTMKGGINELKKELESIKRESRNLQTVFLGTVSLILAIIAILLVLK